MIHQQAYHDKFHGRGFICVERLREGMHELDVNPKCVPKTFHKLRGDIFRLRKPGFERIGSWIYFPRSGFLVDQICYGCDGLEIPTSRAGPIEVAVEPFAII